MYTCVKGVMVTIVSECVRVCLCLVKLCSRNVSDRAQVSTILNQRLSRLVFKQQTTYIYYRLPFVFHHHRLWYNKLVEGEPNREADGVYTRKCVRV